MGCSFLWVRNATGQDGQGAGQGIAGQRLYAVRSEHRLSHRDRGGTDHADHRRPQAAHGSADCGTGPKAA